MSAWFDNSSIQGSIRLDQVDDPGRGFLLSQGYTLVSAGWQADAPAGASLLGIHVPVVAGITGPVRQEWSFGDTTNPHRATLSYPVADRANAQLSVHARADDPRQSPPELKFSFIDDTTIEITRPSGLIPDALYELTYTARDPKVTGMGLAAIRDVTAFLRREGSLANPLAADGHLAAGRPSGDADAGKRLKVIDRVNGQRALARGPHHGACERMLAGRLQAGGEAEQLRFIEAVRPGHR